jgi:hypothetical protein
MTRLPETGIHPTYCRYLDYRFSFLWIKAQKSIFLGGSMKTPLSYYGGKQQLARTILGLVPEHRLYCEPFLGGAAVFFAKKPSPCEVINSPALKRGVLFFSGG